MSFCISITDTAVGDIVAVFRNLYSVVAVDIITVNIVVVVFAVANLVFVIHRHRLLRESERERRCSRAAVIESRVYSSSANEYSPSAATWDFARIRIVEIQVRQKVVLKRVHYPWNLCVVDASERVWLCCQLVRRHRVLKEKFWIPSKRVVGCPRFDRRLDLTCFCMCCCCVSICCCQVHRHIIGCAKKQTRRVSTAASRHFSPRQQHTSTCGFMCLPSYLCVSAKTSTSLLAVLFPLSSQHSGYRPTSLWRSPYLCWTSSSSQSYSIFKAARREVANPSSVAQQRRISRDMVKTVLVWRSLWTGVPFAFLHLSSSLSPSSIG